MEIKLVKGNIECIGNYDVLVIGAGAAGICAAISSSRAGAKTAVVERYGMAGGGLTSGHVAPVMGGTSAGTISEEVHELLGIVPREAHDFERAKMELPNWLERSGVDLYLQCAVADTIMEGNQITGVIIATVSGLKTLTGGIIVDATGDGTVSYMAGTPYLIGREKDGLTQPVSIMFTLAGVSEDAIYCQGIHPDAKVPAGDFVEICKEACANGELPPRVNIVRIYHTGRKTERMINATQVNYVNPLSAKELSDSESNARSQICMIHQFLQRIAPGYEYSFVKGSSSTMGVRESRRITGEYVLSDDDVETGRKFEDVVVHSANFILDIHNPDGAGQAEGEAKRIPAYDIPYRCFVPLRVDNLLVAGRAISGTHRAHSSYRVMNICMAMGQAVGIAAALSAKKQILPRLLDYHLIQQELIKSGVDLFSDKNYEYPFNPHG